MDHQELSNLLQTQLHHSSAVTALNTEAPTKEMQCFCYLILEHWSWPLKKMKKWVLKPECLFFDLPKLWKPDDDEANLG